MEVCATAWGEGRVNLLQGPPAWLKEESFRGLGDPGGTVVAIPHTTLRSLSRSPAFHLFEDPPKKPCLALHFDVNCGFVVQPCPSCPLPAAASLVAPSARTGREPTAAQRACGCTLCTRCTSSLITNKA